MACRLHIYSRCARDKQHTEIEWQHAGFRYKMEKFSVNISKVGQHREKGTNMWISIWLMNIHECG